MLGVDVQAGDAQVTAAFLHLDHDVGRPHEHDVEPGVADDRRFILAVAGPAHVVAGRLQEVDDAVVEVPLGGDSQPDRFDRSGHRVRGLIGPGTRSCRSRGPGALTPALSRRERAMLD